MGNEIKLIEGSVKGDLLTIRKTDGAQKSTDTKKLRPGVFLSSMLLYVIMSNENGLGLNKNYDYYAIAEEEGSVRMGSAFVQKKEKVLDLDAVKILNKFKTDSKKDEERYFVFVTEKGQVLLMRAPDKNIDVRFTKKREDAVKGFEFDRQHMKIVFGDRLPLESQPEVLKPSVKKSTQKKPSKEPAEESLPEKTDDKESGDKKAE